MTSYTWPMERRGVRSLGLLCLSFVLVLLRGEVDATSGALAGSCVPDQIADGSCDVSQNIEACGYDGGDCCECTCVSTAAFTCGDSGFECVDPSVSCIDDDDDFVAIIYDDSTTHEGDTVTTSCVTGFYSDGDCDPGNNNEDCGYDGGDCCECTCVSTTSFTCGEDIHGGFACVDPSASCVDDDDDIIMLGSDDSLDTADAWCLPDRLGDGDCDVINNKEGCGYDGGDCCECTCVSTTEYTCCDEKHGGFLCVDPRASCVDDDDVLTFYTDEFSDDGYSTSSGCTPSYFSNGVCDNYDNNNAICGYDGGDCCECTCVSTLDFTCGDIKHGGFTCRDPQCLDGNDDVTVPVSDDHSDTDGDDITFTPSDDPSDTGDTTHTCFGFGMSDGVCDSQNNNEQCDYDGGDCCECTCVSTSDVTCGSNGYNCIDPGSPCEEDYVEAGTKTTITASANAYDERPGAESGENGCLEDGCEPSLTRDDLTADDAESRWSCAQKIVSDRTACMIEFVFEDPQDIIEVQVAFYKGDERSRTVEAAINGDIIGEFDSYTGSTYNTFDIEGMGVESMTFAAVGLTEDDWLSFTEVRFMVEP